MTKYLILITILIILYLYWKYQQKTQQTKSNSPQPDEIIERQGKQKERSLDDFNKSSETFWDAEDFDLNSGDSDNESTNSND